MTTSEARTDESLAERAAFGGALAALLLVVSGRPTLRTLARGWSARSLPAPPPPHDRRGHKRQGAVYLHGPHSSITITLDRYGHLMPGSEAEAAGLLVAYLEREGGCRA